MNFRTITSSDELWCMVRDYAENCSWRAGKALANIMDNNVFTDWERVIVALDNKKICGYCTVAKTDCIPDVRYTPYIGYLFVDEEYRGNRLSQRMIQYAMNYLRMVGFDKVYIVSDHENLYEKYGFCVIDRKIAPWGSEEKIYVQELNVQSMNIDEIIDNNFRGNIYIVQDDKVICESVTGFADLVNEVPNCIDTKFASASAGKVFVAVGILQLIDRGKIKLDTTLGEILDIDLHSIDDGVTVEQLLNHTSGVPDYFDESVMDEYEELWVDYPNYKIRHNNDLLPLFITQPMMYEKGERFQYNNSGYVLLATIIEKVTGMYFDEYLKESIFDVCDMQSTGYYEFDKLPRKCANSYIYCPETSDFRTNIFSVEVKGTGAGGAFITVKDIVSFWQNLLSGKLLSKELVSAMLQKQSGDGSDPEEGYYGYGMWIMDNPEGTDFAYFQGCDPGVSFLSEYNADKKILSVLVSNYGDNVWKEMRKIREYLYK